MDFRDYITTISETINVKAVDFIIDLLTKSGAEIFSSEAAISWLEPAKSKRHRNCQIKRYYNKDHPFNETGFIEYLKSQIRTSWKKVQEAFNIINDDDKIVDVNTNNEDLFYWSLLNQFQRIHKLPLSPIPPKFQNNNDSSLDNTKNSKKHLSTFETYENQDTLTSKKAHTNVLDSNEKSHNSFQTKHVYDEFKVSFKGYPVEDFLDKTPDNLFHSHLIRDAFEFANHIRYVCEHENSFDKNSEIYKNIVDTNNCLYEYLAFLQDNSTDTQNFLDNFEVKNDVGTNFSEKADKYCKQLKAMYQEINQKIEIIKTEEHKQDKDIITKEHEKVRNWRLSNSLDKLKSDNAN